MTAHAGGAVPRHVVEDGEPVLRRQQRRKLDFLGVASLFPRGTAHTGHGIRGFVRSKIARTPAVGVAGHACRSVLGVVYAQVDGRMGFLHWLGEDPHGREANELALVGGLVLAPQQLHGLDPLAQHLPAALERDTQDLRLLREPAGADAHDEAPAAVKVQGGRRLGGGDDVPLRQDADAGGHPQALGGLGRHGRGDEGIGQMGEGLGHLAVRGALVAGLVVHRDQHVLREPQGLETQPFGLRGDIAHGTRLLRRKQGKTHLHDAFRLVLYVVFRCGSGYTLMSRTTGE